MAGRGRTATCLLRAAALSCGCGLMPGLAQEEPGGLVVTATVAPRLEWSDNLDFVAGGEGGLRASTGLSFGVESTTRAQQLALTASGALTYDLESGEADLQDPLLRFVWRRESRNALIAAAILYRDTEVSSSVLEDAFDPDSLILDNGRRRTLSADLELEFGREAPFGGRLTLGHDSVDYRETTDPDLVDSRSDDASVDLRFDISPLVTAHAAAGWQREDTDGDVDSETVRASLGARADVNPTLNVGADIGWSRTERSGAITDSDEGLTFGLDALLTLRNGTLAGDLSSAVGENGRRTEVRVTRSMELPRGQLSFSAGASRTDGFDVQPLVGIDYVHELPRAQLSVSLNQRTDTDTDGEETVLSSLTVGYRQELTATSSLSASAALREVDVLADGGDDASRVDLTLSYTHALTDEWGLTGGYSRALSRSDAGADVSSNRLFVGLERNFRWRP
jgi:hypothetical protein